MLSPNMHGLSFWKIKKAKTVLHGFIVMVNESKKCPHKSWLDQGKEIYNKLMQKWLHDHDIFMHSTYNDSKSLVAERFIRSLKANGKMTANDSKSYISYLN